ncbi:bifunctional helix-turn-helix domain-containing protein/methylated-DNA--[protein]-cysteine S-methyltransferase [bacterium]|nr:bifunctional helix-turn-helix domain-containing protein/methylated-DNA--[protein]-cysteine S-methyltransferase [bacterium]
MEMFQQAHADYQRIEKALQFLEDNFKEQPTLFEIAESVHLSEFHFQKLFGRWVGISPKRFLQYLTKEHAKKLLQQSKSLLDVTYDSGLSSPGRLHDLFVNCEAITPGEYKEKGKGMTIQFGFHLSPFGEFLLAISERGICNLSFVKASKAIMTDWLQTQWPLANLVKSEAETRHYVAKIFGSSPGQNPSPIHLFIKGTNFQLKVWEALLAVPFGLVVTYEDIARNIGSPKAVRAVGTAIGKNPIPFIIPCHRVIRKMGDFGNYGEGPIRKKVILGWESVNSPWD